MKKLLVMLFAMVMVGFISTSVVEAVTITGNGITTFAKKKKTKKKKTKKTKKKVEEVNQEEKIILDNDFVTVTYLGISPKEYDRYVMSFRIVNKTDKKISIYSRDESIDDVMSYIGFGVSIMPGKTAIEDCSLKDMPKDNIEFKLYASDEDYNDLFETEVIRIDMKK